MKRRYMLPVLVLVSVVFSAFVITDIIQRLGMDHANAQRYIMANFTGGFGSDFDVPEHFINLPRIKTLSAIVNGDKVGAAKELCAYIKQYCSSEEFMAAYEKKRKNGKPTYEPDPVDAETLKNGKESLQEMELQLAEYKKSPNANKEVISGYENGVVNMRTMVAEWEDPTPNLTKWKKNYPEDPAILVKRKLEQYLDLAASVDFNAKLTAPDKYGIKTFVNPDYESKPSEWKACYRAGKEVNDAITIFVKDWLKGEIISAKKVKMPVSSVAEKSPVTETAKNAAPDDQGSTTENNANVTQKEDTKPGAKTKKSFLGKIKEKAKEIIKD